MLLWVEIQESRFESAWVAFDGIWYSEKVNEIEGKLKWYSLLFHPVLACYGSEIEAEKFSKGSQFEALFYWIENDK
jgi:hypothetical protein